MNFITSKNNGIVDLDDVKYIELYGEYDHMQEAIYAYNTEYKPYVISFILKDKTSLNWKFSDENERMRVKNLIQDKLKVEEL